MHRILSGEPNSKFFKLMEFTERGEDVADLWHSDRFDVVYCNIYDGCKVLLKKLISEDIF